MTVYLANCSSDQATRHNRPLVIPYDHVVATTGKVTPRKHKVYLNVGYQGTDEELTISELLESAGPSLLSLDVRWKDRKLLRGVRVPEGVFVFLHVPEDDGPVNAVELESLLEELEGEGEGASAGLGGVRIMSAAAGIEDYRVMHDLCVRYPNLRFEGGVIPRLCGIRVGRFDEGEVPGVKGDGPIDVCDGVYDAVEVVSFSALEGVVEDEKAIRGVKKPRIAGAKARRRAAAVEGGAVGAGGAGIVQPSLSLDDDDESVVEATPKQVKPKKKVVKSKASVGFGSVFGAPRVKF